MRENSNNISHYCTIHQDQDNNNELSWGYKLLRIRQTDERMARLHKPWNRLKIDEYSNLHFDLVVKLDKWSVSYRSFLLSGYSVQPEMDKINIWVFRIPCSCKSHYIGETRILTTHLRTQKRSEEYGRKICKSYSIIFVQSLSDCPEGSTIETLEWPLIQHKPPFLYHYYVAPR